MGKRPDRTCRNRRNWDYKALAEQARHDIGEIRPLLEEVLEPGLLARVVAGRLSSSGLPVDDEPLGQDRLCVRGSHPTETGRPSISRPSMFVPLYLWRAAAFMAHAALESDAIVQARLDSL